MQTISNLAYQVNALASPKNEMHFLMNAIYTGNSALCFTLFIVGVCRPRKAYLSFVAFALTMIRNEVRMLDFEQTYDPKKLSDWVTLVCLQFFVTAYNMSIISNNFNFHKSKLVVLFASFVLFVPMFYSAINIQEDNPIDFIKFLF